MTVFTHLVRPARTRRAVAAFTLSAALIASGCSSDDDAGSTTEVTNGWDNPDAGRADGAPTITAPTGDAPTELEITDLAEGDGEEAVEGSFVVVDYIGALFDTGTVFDASYGRSPFSLQLGAGQVIKGWDQGLVGMKVGGTRQIVIPAELGYGSQAQGQIPANATLIFVVELRQILERPTDIAPIEGGVTDELVIEDITEGTGPAAEVGSTVQAHYVLIPGEGGETIDSSWDRGSAFPVTLGSGQVIEGWEQGLIGIRAGGRRRLEVPASLAYGESGQGPIGPNASLVFIVDAVSVS